MKDNMLDEMLDMLGLKDLDKYSLEYDILMSMEDDSWWLKEMKKEHNFYEL